METQPIPEELTGREGREFNYGLAQEWTKNYREKHPGEALSQFFGKEILQKLLDQPGCMGIRMYYAHDKPLNKRQRTTIAFCRFLTKVIGNMEGNKHLILVGAYKDGSDMLPDTPFPQHLQAPPMPAVAMKAAAPAAAPASSLVVQVAMPCPGSANCPKNSLTGDK